MDRQVTQHDATLLVDSQCELGEALTWCTRRQAWLWSDIEQSRIWMHRPSDGLTRSFSTPDRVGAFVVCDSGALLLGLAKGLGLAALDIDGSDPFDVRHLEAVEPDLPTTRINDGRTDRSGAFVFGTFNVGHAEPIGSLYQYTRTHGLRRLDVGSVTCANSICFSADGGTMFFADSPTRRILRCDYNSERASVGPVTTFVELGAKQGLPDGSIIDGSGGLWNAEWGSGRVRRYDLSGQMTDEVRIATPHATCPAFGGADHSDLCITSARPAARHPAAGGLFHARIERMHGIPDELFRQ
jgi:L-arabinonolactonase